MSAAEAAMHELAQKVLKGDDLERRLALNVLLGIALTVARAEDAASERRRRPPLTLVEEGE